MKPVQLLCAVLVLFPLAAQASSVALVDIDIKREPENLKRGAQVVHEVCMSCHSLKYIKYRQLLDLGFTEHEVDTLRAGADSFNPLMSRMPAEAAEAAFGVVPPDLSLIVKAKKGGPRYLYTLLTSYYVQEDGKVNNELLPDINMPDIFGHAGTRGNQRTEVENKIKDVAAFLEWAADPHAGNRYRMGYFVMAYLFILTALLYVLKKRVWRRLEGSGHQG